MIKCIVWDLDKTLWDGVLLEDATVQLKSEALIALQLAHEKGIIQSICSKNDLEMVLVKLTELHISDFFILPQISFDNKGKQISKLLNAIHIRSTNTLFVDDDAFERSEVLATLPDIKVVDGTSLQPVVHMLKEFPNISPTKRKERHEQYKTEEHRILEAARSNISYEDFLHACDMRICARRAVPDDLERIEELIQRTNQLNTSGRFLTKEEILKYMSHPNWYIDIFEVGDRYGSYGKAGLTICEKCGDTLLCHLLIVSCRLLNKGVTTYLLHYIAETALRKGFKRVSISYIRRSTNRPMLVLLTMNGLKKEETKQKDWSLYSINLESGVNPITTPSWIRDITPQEFITINNNRSEGVTYDSMCCLSRHISL